MAIERHTFTPPFKIYTKHIIPMDEQILRGLRTIGHRSENLPRGEHNLTPPEEKDLDFRILVFPQGNGIFKMTLKEDDAVATVTDGKDINVKVASGLVSVRLPEDIKNDPRIAVASDVEGRPEKLVHEVLVYTPGRSPKRAMS